MSKKGKNGQSKVIAEEQVEGVEAQPKETPIDPAKVTAKKVLIRDFRLLYGGLIAFTLVLIYVGASLYLLYAAFSPEDEVIEIGIETVYTTVGALLSATVVALFAVTPPGDHPATQFRSGTFGGEAWTKLDWSFGEGMEADSKEKKKEARKAVEKLLERIINLYVGIWVLFGALALVVGVMVRPQEVPVLTIAGNAWLGIAVASIYAYLGISDKGKKQG